MKHSRHAASTICKFCGRRILNHGLAAHKRACQHHPGEAVLREMRQERGLTVRQIAARCGVGRSTIYVWLTELPNNGRQQRPAELQLEPPPAWLCAYAPYSGRRGACDENCPGWQECQRRVKRKLFDTGSTLWPLCAIPLPHEVERARELGYINAD